MASRPHETAADAVQLVGGALLVGSLFVPWTAQGPGSSLDAHQIGALFANGALDALVPRWAAALLYAGPLGGALAAIAVGLHSGHRRWVERAALVLVALTAIPAALVAAQVPPGGGILLTLAGGLAVAGAVVADVLLERRGPRGRDDTG